MRFHLVASAAVAAFAGVLSIPTAAEASGQDAIIETNEFVFYYSAGYTGSYSDFATSKADLSGYEFIKSGLSGYGTPVRNNSASVRNKRSQAARVYYSPNYLGVSDYVDPLGSRDLVNTRNDNASFRWI